MTSSWRLPQRDQHAPRQTASALMFGDVLWLTFAIVKALAQNPIKVGFPSQAADRPEPRPHAYSVPACWFRSTAVIIRVAVALNAALKSKLASTPAGPSMGVLASAR